MFAIISYQGNQYKVFENQNCKIDFLDEQKNKKIVFSDVLVISDDKKSYIGTPNIAGASVEAEIVENTRDEKVNILKFHSKKHYQRTAGHKQKKTIVKILKISISKSNTNGSVSSKSSSDKKNEK